MQRDWQNWDKGRVAEIIEAYWQSNVNESAHREQLLSLVSCNLSTPRGRVLEVGCGTGLIYQRLVPTLLNNTDYVGVDVSDKMLDIARRNFPDGIFLRGDGYELSFADGAFDTVLCFEVLGHILHIEKFVSELLRVANKNSIFTVWPSAGADIIESYEYVDGIRFLHRQYADSYIRRIICSATPKRGNHIKAVELPTGVRAYIV